MARKIDEARQRKRVARKLRWHQDMDREREYMRATYTQCCDAHPWACGDCYMENRDCCTYHAMRIGQLAGKLFAMREQIKPYHNPPTMHGPIQREHTRFSVRCFIELPDGRQYGTYGYLPNGRAGILEFDDPTKIPPGSHPVFLVGS